MGKQKNMFIYVYEGMVVCIEGMIGMRLNGRWMHELMDELELN